MTLKVQGNTVVDTNLTYTVNGANVSAGGNVSWFVPLLDGASTGFQGTIAGYASGGTGLPGPGSSSYIQKILFSIDSNSTDVGDLTEARSDPAGQSSSTHGYTAGGNKAPPAPTRSNTIDKFPFAADTNATNVGDLTGIRLGPSGQSSTTNGYTSAGDNGPAYVNTIDKYPFASDTNATDVGDASQLKAYLAGNSSTTNGYITGGYNPGAPPSPFNTIDKFPFASDTNASDIGDLTQVGFSMAGQSSTTHGYTSGRRSPPSSNVIDKFPFASDTNATDVGDLVTARGPTSGQSSTVSGYSSGGFPPPNGASIIDKFPFATDTNASSVGNLSAPVYGATGQQN